MLKMIYSFVLVAMLSLVSLAQSGIQSVDFGNFTFAFNDKTVKFKEMTQESACEKKDEDGIVDGDRWSFFKEGIAFGDLDGDGKDEAVIPLTATLCTGNMVTDEAVLVYTMKNGKPYLMPSFDYYVKACDEGEECGLSRSPGVSVAFDDENKAIIIETSFFTEDDALCCPSVKKQNSYKWNGSEFVEIKKDSPQPKTVTDYYLAMPNDLYSTNMSGDKIKGKTALTKFRKSLIKIEDIKSGYLKLEGTWEGWAEIALFKKTDGSYLVAHAESGCGPACDGFVKFYNYKSGKWIDMTKQVFPEISEADIEKLYKDKKLDTEDGVNSYFLLPRIGKTVKLACNMCSDGDDENFTLLELEWSGSKFIKK